MKIWRVAVGVSILSASSLASSVSGYEFGNSGQDPDLKGPAATHPDLTLDRTAPASCLNISVK